MEPTSLVWRMLEFYGIRIKHRGKSRLHDFLRSRLGANADCNLEVERQGLNWWLNPSDFVQRHLYWTGEYEPWDARQLLRWIRPGGIVFDVGANFGYYSVLSASALRANGGQVFAFEPCPATFSRLRKNIALNDLQSAITPILCGLSNHRGLAFLNEGEGNSGAATISTRGNGEPIKLDTLDNFCGTRQLNKIDVIKIDVEGGELQVLEGGRDAVSRYRPLMMIEFNSLALERAGTSVEELRMMLSEMGYQLSVICRDGLVPFAPEKEAKTIVNVFCVPAGRQPPQVMHSESRQT